MGASFEAIGRELGTRVDRLDQRILGGARTSAVLGWAGFASAGLLLALLTFGMLMVATLVAFLVVPILIVVAAGLPIAVARLGGARPWAHVAAIVLPAIVVPLVGLLGFDVLWGAVHLRRPGPLLGLAIASVVVGGLEYLYLRWAHRTAPARPAAWAGWAALAGLALYVATRRIQWPEPRILIDTALLFGAVWAYLVEVTGPHVKRPFWWAALLVLGFVFTVPLVAEALQRAKVGLGAIAVFVVAVAALVVYARRVGRDNPHDQAVVRRHLWPVLIFAVAIVAAAGVARAAGVSPQPPVGAALPAAVPPGRLPAYAIDHRPILLFDSGEVLRTPIDIDDLFRSGLVERCPEGKGLLGDCQSLGSVDDLTTDGGDLRFRTESFDNDSFDSRIYVHVVPHGSSIYLDYWWYLPDNPANTARGAMCGAGLVIPEITCFDHQSDWEGVTVVLDRATKELSAVHYAAHKFTLQVPWPVAHAGALAVARKVGLTAADVAQRPVVFIARGTHAAYPTRCVSDFCATSSLSNDNQFDGRNPWSDNACAACVSAFPSTATGRAASWNAFSGHWGTALCLAKDLYCARSDAPRSPAGQHGRFAHPWCITHTEADLRRRPTAVATPCSRQGGT